MNHPAFLPFDKKLLKEGENLIQRNVSAGDLDSGVFYDYPHLEFDENADQA